MTALASTRGQLKLTKPFEKILAIVAHRQTVCHVRFTQVTLKAQSRGTQRTECTSYRSLRFSITLLLPQTCRNIWVASDEEKLVSLLCAWVLIDHGLPRSHVTPGAPARKEVFETALGGSAQTQSDVFLVFSGTRNPLVKTVFLARSTKVDKKKIQVQTLHCSQQLLSKSSQSNQTSTRNDFWSHDYVQFWTDLLMKTVWLISFAKLVKMPAKLLDWSAQIWHNSSSLCFQTHVVVVVVVVVVFHIKSPSHSF